MSADNRNLQSFRLQAGSCRSLGSPLTATILEALADTLDETTETGRAIIDWPGNALVDALPLRLTGALHALALRGTDRELTALYTGEPLEPEAILKRVVGEQDRWLRSWLDSPPQTNEIGRSAALIAGLSVASGRLGLPIELLEIGASAGLNLNLDRFEFRLGETALGGPSAVRLAPAWTGPSPPAVMPEIFARRGADKNPLDPTDPEVAERLIAYIWPDQHERLSRTRAAIKIAHAHLVTVERADAGDWIEQQLALPQREGTLRAVMHSVFWQYLVPETQQRIEQSINKAGAQATGERPLAWLSFEPGPNLWTMALTLRLWPGDETLDLALCHPHGASIEWKG